MPDPTQQRLFRPSVEAVIVNMAWEPYVGWQVRINARRDGDEWADEPATFYGELSASEAADVVAAELWVLLIDDCSPEPSGPRSRR